MLIVTLIGLWLATYRVSRLIVADTITVKPRTLLLMLLHSNNHPGLAKGLTCHWCEGFWLSGIAVLIVANLTSIPLPVMWWFAISTAVGLTGKLDA